MRPRRPCVTPLASATTGAGLSRTRSLIETSEGELGLRASRAVKDDMSRPVVVTSRLGSGQVCGRPSVSNDTGRRRARLQPAPPVISNRWADR